jgi:hypothetical protein
VIGAANTIYQDVDLGIEKQSEIVRQRERQWRDYSSLGGVVADPTSSGRALT